MRLQNKQLTTEGAFESLAPSYAEIGWPVFPLAPGSKIPVKGSRGFKDASTDPELIARWAKDYPNANIGVATGGAKRLLVVDIDPRHGGDKTVFELACQGLRFPRAPEQVTGNKGRHKVFTLPDGIEISRYKLGEGVDIKCHGGYIVAGGSTTGPSEAGPGGKYLWLLSPWHQEPPPLPWWCIRRLQPPRQDVVVPFSRSNSPDVANRRLDALAMAVANAPSGSRNNTLNWAAFTAGELVRDGHVPVGAVERALTSAALQCGLTPPEITRTIDGALKAAQMKGRSQ